MTRLYDQALRSVGLRVTQHTLLRMLDRLGGATSAKLSYQLAINTTTLSRTLRLLRRRGWITAAPGERPRERRLTVTPAGRRKLARAEAHWERVQAEVRTTIGQREWNRVMATLERVTAALSA